MPNLSMKANISAQYKHYYVTIMKHITTYTICRAKIDKMSLNLQLPPPG